MIIGFATDTNIINKSNKLTNSNFLSSLDLFYDYSEMLKKAQPDNPLIYFMPEIVLNEFVEQERTNFNNSYNDFEEKYNNISYGIEGNIPKNNINNIISNELQNYSKKYELLKLKYNNDIFQELVNKSLKKFPPFDKSIEGKKTDAGFKDALIWTTIIYSEEIDKCNKFYFFTCDKVFKENSDKLEKEFCEKHLLTKIKIVFLNDDTNKCQYCLKKIIDENNLPEIPKIKLYDETKVLEDMKKVKYNYQKMVSIDMSGKEYSLSNIDFTSFSENDINIDNVNSLGNEYETFVSFSTKKYQLSSNDNSYFPALKGKIKLLYNTDSDENLNLKSYEIVNVYFVNFDVSELIKIASDSLIKTQGILNNLGLNYSIGYNKALQSFTESMNCAAALIPNREFLDAQSAAIQTISNSMIDLALESQKMQIKSFSNSPLNHDDSILDNDSIPNQND